MLDFSRIPEIALSSSMGKKRNWEHISRHKTIKEASGVKRTGWKMSHAGISMVFPETGGEGTGFTPTLSFGTYHWVFNLPKE